MCVYRVKQTHPFLRMHTPVAINWSHFVAIYCKLSPRRMLVTPGVIGLPLFIAIILSFRVPCAATYRSIGRYRKLVTLINFNWFTQIQFTHRMYIAMRSSTCKIHKQAIIFKTINLSFCSIGRRVAFDDIDEFKSSIFRGFSFRIFQFSFCFVLQISPAKTNLCESSPWSNWTSNQLVLLYSSSMVLCGTEKGLSRSTVAR